MGGGEFLPSVLPFSYLGQHIRSSAEGSIGVLKDTARAEELVEQFTIQIPAIEFLRESGQSLLLSLGQRLAGNGLFLGSLSSFPLGLAAGALDAKNKNCTSVQPPP